MRKNNITLGLQNTISFLNNLISHFREKKKIITLSLSILMLSFVNIILYLPNSFSNSVSALSYSSNVDIGFTFNPVLSISISSNNLVISNLTPGSTLDSNNINVSVATNAAYGYTLSATVGSSDINSPHYNNNLTHSNNNDIFSSIAIDADLSSLIADNTWGYSYKDNTVVSPAWSNYSGLPNIDSKTLLDNNNVADSTGSIDFKIAAKAGNTQASGTYTNTINFVAVAKPAPITLLDAFIASGAEQSDGYFKMQDMTSSICSNVDVENSELQLIDKRDDKVYWVAKLKDGHCWMTQNLDFDITAGTTTITSDNTDLSTNESVYTDSNTIYALKEENDAYGYTYKNGIATWIPERSTIAYNQLNNISWQDSTIYPYSYDRLDISNSKPLYPDNDATQVIAGNHGLSGNYYNWAAAIASNNSTKANGNLANSICPKGWRLPYAKINNEFSELLTTYNNFNVTPLYFVKGGYVEGGIVRSSSNWGYYWSGSFATTKYAYSLSFNNDSTNSQAYGYMTNGRSLRCLAR